jgi:hypothetical protein
MITHPVHDLLVRRLAPNEEETYGYYIYASGENPLGVSVQGPQLTGAVVDTAGQSGGVYSVRDQGQPALVLNDWSLGAGQKSYETEGSSSGKFYSSKNIDTSVRGEFRLGPMVTTTDDTKVKGIMLNALSKVWMTFTSDNDAANDSLRYWGGSAWVAVPFAEDPDEEITCLATDGEYVYMAFATKGVYRVKDSDGDGSFADEQIAAWDAEAGITNLAFMGGYLYGAKAAAVGYFDATPAWNQLSPTAVGASNTTFGLASAGNWAYWGTTNLGVTKLYRTQFDGTNEWFEDVCDFPSGFYATCMSAYLGNVFIAGYYKCATASVGQGALYMVTDGTPTLITIVGDNPDYTSDPSNPENDNRIWAMHPYGKDLFLLCSRKVIRWDLDDGGWTHICDVDPATSTSMTWITTDDSDYDASVSEAAPASPWAATTAGATVVTYSAPSLLVACPAGTGAAVKLYTNTGITTFATATGSTMEVEVPVNSIQGTNSYARQIYGIDDGTDDAYFEAYKYSATRLALSLPTYNKSTNEVDYAELWEVDLYKAHTYRLTLKNGTARLYCDDVYLGKTAACKASTDERAYFGTNFSASNVLSRSYVDSVKVSASGSFAPGEEFAVSPMGGIAKGDQLFAGITGVGYAKEHTIPYAADGWIRSSLSSQRSGSLLKRYHRLIVDHDGLAGSSITAAWYIDGGYATASGTTVGNQTIFDIASQGHNIALVITLASNTAQTVTPVVRAVTVTYDFDKYKQHNYVLDCRRGTAGDKWTDSPEKAITHLFTVADEGGTFESRFATAYEGLVESCQFIQAQRDEHNNLEGIVQLVVREIE